MIKVIQHDTIGATTVMAYDHAPYSSNPSGAPQEVAEAVRAGFGLNLPDFDCRCVEWREDVVIHAAR